MVPYFECPIPSYLFRIIDNDTNTEVPRVFHSTPPQVYQPNARGYTFQTEAWNSSSAEGVLSDESRWSLRIVSSNEELPEIEGEMANEEVTSTFHTKEVVDYCLPDRDGCMFRYTVFCISYPDRFLNNTSLCELQILSKGDARLSG